MIFDHLDCVWIDKLAIIIWLCSTVHITYLQMQTPHMKSHAYMYVSQVKPAAGKVVLAHETNVSLRNSTHCTRVLPAAS